MMNKSNKGFILLEAVLSVVIVSICLTFIAQALLTNFRSGIRFQEMSRALIIMENNLSLLYATNDSSEDFDSYPKTLEKPYDKFKLSTATSTINTNLKNVNLVLYWPAGKKQGQLDLATIIYTPNQNQENG